MEPVQAGTAAKGDRTVHVTLRRTVHGPVSGYARVASSRRSWRSRAGARPTAARPSIRSSSSGSRSAASATPASSSHAAARRRRPSTRSTPTGATSPSRRRAGCRSTPGHQHGPAGGRSRRRRVARLPRRRSACRRVVGPASGAIVNWNNKPARDLPAAVRVRLRGPIMRTTCCSARSPRDSATPRRACWGRRTRARSGIRARLLWPVVSAVLARGRAPNCSPRDGAHARRWAARGGGWVDSRRRRRGRSRKSNFLAAWDRPRGRRAVRALGHAVCRRLAISARASTPAGRDQYGRWHQYMCKDLRTLLVARCAGTDRLALARQRIVSLPAPGALGALEATAPGLPRRRASRTGRSGRWRR